MAKSKNKVKIVIIVCVVVLLVAMIVVGIVKKSKGGQVTVQTQKAQRTDIISIVSGSGRIQPRTQVNITSEVTAEIINIPVKEGDSVTKGTILIQLDTVQLEKDMEAMLYAANELDARLKGSQVLLDQAKDEYERQKGLFQKQMTAEQAYKAAFYNFRSQEANYLALLEQKKAATSRLDKARDNLKKTTISAPIEGVITWVDAETGEIAQAQTSFTQGMTLMILSDLSSFEVEAEIDETDIAAVEIGQKVNIEIDAFPDQVFRGKVIEIGNTATTSGLGSNEQMTNFKVKIEILDTHQKIRPGMSATVDITTHERFDVLAVPIQAMVLRADEPDPDKEKKKKSPEKKEEKEKGQTKVTPVTEKPAKEPGKLSPDKEKKKGVFVNRAGEAKFVPVKTGISDQQNIEIITGLQENDEVVVGSFRTLRTLKDETRIKVEKKTTEENTE
ncbi:efflux RND transporter periplasmic adaptor subunit [candidate division CSSED10-310 bacterium]|uniref:Efflux RND transporter periplasmic adaptor subunit n=1 Tax=candidate division CSSED10-310 bacterium TaxID=2855610 RepID=A0ABV6Z472_UNCC1